MKREAVFAENISLSSEGVPLLDRFSILLIEGETTALAGVNGSGKSHLTEWLSGMRPADQGTVACFGKSVDSSQLRRLVAAIWRDDHLIRPLTVAENVLLQNDLVASCTYRRKQMHFFAQEILKSYQLESYLSVPTADLPASVQHLILIIREILNGKKIILLNNITVNYSLLEMERLVAFLKQINQQRITVLFLSNKWNKVFELACSTLVMCEGRSVKVFWWEEPKRSELAVYAAGSHRKRAGALDASAYAGVLPDLGLEAQTPTVGLRFERQTFHSGQLIGLHDTDDSKEDFLRSFSQSVSAQTNKAPAYFDSRSLSDELIPAMSLMDHLLLLLSPLIKRWHGLLKQEYRLVIAEEMERRLEIPRSYLNLPIRRLTRTERFKLLLFARRFRNPPAFLFDHLTLYSDDEEKRLLFLELKQLVKEEYIVLFLSSDLHELMSICPLVYSIREGKIKSESVSGE